MMKIISDLHLHSKYARGCSKDLNISNMEKWARIKGIDLLGTGDFTHPKWIQELRENLKEENDSGIYKTKTGFPFILTTEISLIYTDLGKGRKIHNIVWAPNFDVVGQITEYLLKKGRVDYDGRPIFKIPSDEFVYELHKIDKDVEIIPAHIWTPWFSLFGANSGYNSIKDCFKDQEKNVHAIETGMSSDPSMNWRIEELKNKKILSFSDSHSFWPWRLAREATIFNLRELSFKNISKAIRSDFENEDSNNKIEATIEVDPGYGKYHFTGHRNCKIVMNPMQSQKINNICPVCKKVLTVGVLERVEELASHEEGYRHEYAKNFYSLIPLSEIVSGLYKTGISSKKTWEVYNTLIKQFGSELNILLNASDEELEKSVDPRLLALIINNRKGMIKVKPGFDGVYGIPLILGNENYDFGNPDLESNGSEPEITEQSKKKLNSFNQKNNKTSEADSSGKNPVKLSNQKSEKQKSSEDSSLLQFF